MLERLVRQRRRVILGAVAALVAIPLGLPDFVILQVTLLGLVLILFYPRGRFLFDYALAALMVTHALHLPKPAVLILFWGLFGLLVLNQRVGQRLVLPWPWTATRRRDIAAAPETVFGFLDLDPDRPPRDPAIVKVTPHTDGLLKIQFANGCHNLAQVSQRIPGRTLHLVFDGVEFPMRSAESVEIEATAKGCRVTLRQTLTGVPVMMAAIQWLDDSVGDALDRLAALAEGRRDRSVTGAVLRPPPQLFSRAARR